KILLVASSPASREVLKNILAPLGFAVDELTGNDMEADTGTGREAIGEGCTPDAVLAVLPAANGEELVMLQRIKAAGHLHNTPVFLLADQRVFSALEENQPEELEKLCTARVVKPFSSADLLSVFAKHLPITLVYEEKKSRNEQELVPPPAEELEALLLKVRQGDIAEMNRQISLLAEKDAGKYKVFAAKIKRLAEDFQLNMIVDVIKRYGSSQ
ncbi:MAG: response regulator, partial [Candidatus Electrothrix sp. EH2]|nr:response regulator [Candidatus Electrothrix sp. EH2]